MSDDEILWWAKGGKLKGKSPERIAFLRSIMEELPENLEYSKSLLEQTLENSCISIPNDPNMEKVMNMIAKELKEVSEVRAQRHLDKERIIMGHCGDKVYMRYFSRQCASVVELELSENKRYDIELIDVWEMTRMKVLSGVRGKVGYHFQEKRELRYWQSVSKHSWFFRRYEKKWERICRFLLIVVFFLEWMHIRHWHWELQQLALESI